MNLSSIPATSPLLHLHVSLTVDAALPRKLPLSSPPPKFTKNPLPKTLISNPAPKSLTSPNLTPKQQTLALKSQPNHHQALLLFLRFKSDPSYTPNTIHYNIVLRFLGKAHKWNQLQTQWTQMAKDSVFPTNNTYSTLIDVFAKAGLVKEALLWLKHMKSRGIFPDEVTMGTVIRVLRDSGNFELARRFYRGWCDGRVEMEVLGGFDNVGESSTIGFLVTEMLKVGMGLGGGGGFSGGRKNRVRLVNTYNLLIDLFGKAGKLEEAAECFREMLGEGVEPDAFTFNTMIHICGENGNVDEAEALLRKMEERRIRPDTKTYNVFMSLYADIGDVDGVLRWHGRIKETGLRCDVVSWRIVLKVLCEKKMVNNVENVIEEIMGLGSYVDQQCLPVVMKMYIDEGLLGKASSFFEKHCCGRDVSSKNYAAIIDAYAEKGYWKEAEDVFFTERSKGQKKDGVEYNVMIKAYGKAKLYDKALSLFESMRACGTWPDEYTYNSLIQMLSVGDLPDRARELLRKMKEAGFRPRIETFSAIISSYSRTGIVSEAVEIFREMKALGVEPNEIVFGSIIDGFAETERVEEALEYIRMMEESGLSPNRIVLTSLIKVYSKVNCWKEAQKVYAKIKRLDGGPDTIASNCMVNVYANLGMVNEAKMIFEDMRKNNRADGVSYATMMYLYKNMGMLNEATDIAKEAQSSGILTNCTFYNTVMASYADHRKLEECANLLHQMMTRKILPDASTFKILFTIMKKGGLAPETISQLESAYSNGKPFARQTVITSVFSVVGFHSLAAESCDAFVKTGLPLDSFAYNVAICAYGAADKVDKALNMFMKMQDEGLEPDVVTYINLSPIYGKEGMVEGLRRIYEQLKYGEIEPSKSLYRALIDAYRDAGKEDLAQLVEQEMRFSNVEDGCINAEYDCSSEDGSSSEAEDHRY